MSRVSSVIIVRNCCLFHLLGKLGDLAFDHLQVLDHTLARGLIGGLASARGFAILSTGLVPPLETLGGKVLLLFGRQGVILVLGVVSIFNSFELAFATTSLQLRDIDRSRRLAFRGLADVILIKSHTGVEIASELLIGHDMSFHSIKLIRLDPIKKEFDLGPGVNSSIAMFDKAFHDRMLLLVNVYMTFEVPMALLTVIDRVLQLVLGLCCHVINIVWTEEMLVEAIVSHPAVASFLGRLHICPGRVVSGDL